MFYGCQNSTDSRCDTQVYVTWKGTDSTERNCESDNYRLTGMADFMIKSYVAEAEQLPTQAVENGNVTPSSYEDAGDVLNDALQGN